MRYHLSVYGLSDIGLVRKNNEDVWHYLLDKHFFILADGMGGHQAGEVASNEAVTQVCELVKNKADHLNWSPEEACDFLFDSIQKVNKNLYNISELDETLKGMGTTLCCVLLLPASIVCAYVGDSRIYLFRDKKITQISQDHSLLRELIELGQIDEKDVDSFPYKHIITRAMGTEPYVEPSVFSQPLQVEDMVLICSDGLSDMLKNEEIEQILKETVPANAPKKLISAAKQKGGNDNITVVVIKIRPEL